MGKNVYEKISSQYALLKQSIKDKNTITENEFRQFLPLFKKDGLELLGAEKYDRLSRIYMDKISLYDPVTIVSDTVNEDDGTPKVLLVLPAKFNAVPTFNDVKSGNITDIFFNSVIKESNNPMDVSLIKTSNHMANVLTSAALVANENKQHEYDKIMDDFNNGVVSKNDDNAMKTDGLVWDEF